MASNDRLFFAAARTLVGACAAGLLAACSPPARPDGPRAAPRPAAPASPALEPAQGRLGVDAEDVDRSVKPGDDFYRYVNGRWHDKAEIPPDRSNFGTHAALAEEVMRRTHALLEAAARGGEGGEVRKVGDLYASFIDDAGIEQKGAAPLKPALDRIASIGDRRALARALGETLRADVDPLNRGDVITERLFGLWVAEDLNEPARHVPYLLQGGLGLPDREYYLDGGPRFAKLRDKYQKHIAATLGLAGMADAGAKAQRVYELEKKIAAVHSTQVDTRDVKKANNPYKREDFAKKAPGLDWGAYFDAAGLGGQGEFIVWQPSALAGIARLAGREPLDVWKAYLTFHAVSRAAPFLPKAFADEAFAFYGRELSGAERPRERWKSAVDFVNGAMGEAVGKLYVEKYFSPRAKAAAEAMARVVVAAFGRRLDALAWMAPETRAKAKEKLAALEVGMGHPAAFRDYAGLEVRPGDAYGNAERASFFEHRESLAKLGRRPDRSEWLLLPQVLNAICSPQKNSIVFPAAILQPPFFDEGADPAANYGGIGAVIGHEIAHSFDDQGAEFDAGGRLSNWWTPEDAARFKAAGRALAEQYGAYRPLPDAPINGELTLGENIADAAGLAVAFDAYRASLGGRPAPRLEGYTGEQRFFMGFAQVWRSKYREPALRRLLLTNGHSPGPYRAATVRNQDGWYEAFDVRPGQALYLAPERRVRVW